jgi:hypothetical protein
VIWRIDWHSATVRQICGVLYAIGIAIWTWKLLEPKPVSEEFILQLRSWLDILPFLLAKLLHFTGYSGLTGLFMITLGRHWRIAVILMILHGIGTEIGQTFVPNRTGKVTDVFLDSCGILLGAFITRLLVTRTQLYSESASPPE